MALKSMTGFGHGTASSLGLRADVELSSVNRKQLDVHVALPKGLAALESRVAQLINKSLSRGYVTVSIRVGAAQAPTSGAIVNDKLARAYVSALRKTAHELGLKDDLAASVLTRLPDVVRTGEEQVDVETAWPSVNTALKQALGRLTAMRLTEGKTLHRDLARRIAGMKATVVRIGQLAGGVTAKYRTALLARLAEAGHVLDLDDPRLLKELTLYADRCDITEEITRLGSHFGQIVELLAKDQPVGRTMDFLVQEMFREITTIGSKANDADISRHVVVFKTELERIREQVQNVE